MATITLEYNPANELANSIVNSIKSAGVFKIKREDSPYNEDFVKQIQKSRKNKGVVIKTEDLWR
ncbi:MAG: hypothetical protein LBE91_09615 [Tannerella sp.]|jgi:hypothetical protein|nr:hypothetical protein [Tannerella sp.]